MENFIKAVNNLMANLPEWADGTIRILNNQELVAYRNVEGEVKIKKSRCVQCGECCLDTPDGHTPFGSDDEGKCNALEKEGDKWICKAGHQKPDSCLYDPLPENAEGCSIEYF